MTKIIIKQNKVQIVPEPPVVVIAKDAFTYTEKELENELKFVKRIRTFYSIV